jgi:hypothetical protein
MNNKSIILSIGLLAILSATSCASRPSAIAPLSVSALEYKGLSCDETKALLDQKRATLTSVSKKQNQAATGDAVGVFFLLIPVGSVVGADNEGAVAQAKGEVIALERAIQINCKAETNE